MSVIRDVIESFSHAQQHHGWRSAWGQTAQFLLLLFFEYHRGFLLRRSLRDPINIPKPEQDVTIRQATVDDSSLLETLVPPLRVKRFITKMQAGEICFIAIQDQRVIAYVFAGLAHTPSTEDIELELGPREAYLWAAYALPEYRRQGVVGALNLSLCKVLREDGYETTVLLLDESNIPSLGHCYKIGYHVTDKITYLRLLGWRMNRSVPIEDFAYEPGVGEAAD